MTAVMRQGEQLEWQLALAQSMTIEKQLEWQLDNCSYQAPKRPLAQSIPIRKQLKWQLDNCSYQAPKLPSCQAVTSPIYNNIEAACTEANSM